MPIAKAEMLIRKLVAEVFEAFVDPAITSRVWFIRGSGRLEPGRQVTWEWEMYSVSAQVSVKAVERNRQIQIEWSAYGGPTTVDAEAVAEQAISSTEGFTLVLAGFKALLEHGVRLDLVADRFPKGLERPS